MENIPASIVHVRMTTAKKKAYLDDSLLAQDLIFIKVIIEKSLLINKLYILLVAENLLSGP